ncbi:MAG: tRNA-dihydrouridine synthase family protein [Thermoleophilaceae bacterium]
MRLQARRYGAGFVVSEMVSSFGLKHGNERTLREFLRIHPDEHPVSMQLFGHDADVMREASSLVAEAGADIVDLNMGCPVRKVCKTGAGAALLDDPDKAVAIARAAGEGSGLPVTVKLRPGQRPGDRAGVTLARRLVEEAGVAGIAFHPRHASQQHKGSPDYELAREVVEALEVPVIVSGGLLSDDRAQEALDRSGAEAVMLARGLARQPLALRAPAGPARRRTLADRGDRRASLGDRPGRRAPRHRSRRALPAQVLPLVRRAPGDRQAPPPGARDGARHRLRQGRAERDRGSIRAGRSGLTEAIRPACGGC